MSGEWNQTEIDAATRAAQAAYQTQCEAAAAAQLALAAAREPPSHNRSRHAQYWAII